MTNSAVQAGHAFCLVDSEHFFLDFETSSSPVGRSDQKAAAQALGLDPLRDQFCGAGQSRFCLVDSEPCQMRRIVQNA